MSLEDRLAAWGAAELAAAGDPPPLQVPPVRRRWAPLAAAAAVVAVAGGAVLLASSGGEPAPDRPAQPTQRVVPWAPLEPLGLQPSAQPAATADPSVRACRPTDLRGSRSGEGEGSGGNLFDAFVLTNASTTACRLTGRVESLSTVVRGRQPSVRTDTWPAREADLVATAPVVLAPGESGQAAFVVYTRCDDGGAGRTYGEIRLQALGGTIEVPGTLDLGCAKPSDGIAFGDLGGPANAEPSYEFDPVAELVPSLQLPATVEAGEVLRFTVTLTNPTVDAVALDPCPDFLVTSAGVKETYALNCGQAEPVPVGGQEVFAMELPVPFDANGPTTVTWSLARPGGQEAQGTVEVMGGESTNATESCTSDQSQPPCAAGLQAGESYPYVLYTHCGLRGLYADGREWRPEEGQVTDDGSDNPPPGVGNPSDRGTLRVESPDRLSWTPASGKVAVFFRPRTTADVGLYPCS